MADPNTKSLRLEAAARELGFAVRRLDHYVLVVDIEGVPHQFLQTCGPSSSAAAKYVCDHKALTRATLQAAGLPLNEGAAFEAREVEEALAYAASLPPPVVVKPEALSQGRGVSLWLETPEAVRAAIEGAVGAGSEAPGGRFLVERQLVGAREYRFTVVAEQVAFVSERIPATVVGDGASSIADLLVAENVRRATDPLYRKEPIPTEHARLGRLRRLGIPLRTVPAAGERVQVQDVISFSQGGTIADAFDTVHPGFKDLAVRAIAAIPGMRYGGVDVFARDVTAPPRLDDGSCAIGEVEFSPAWGGLAIANGRPDLNFGRAVLEYYARLVREGRPATAI